jgi:hypothetical protein
VVTHDSRVFDFADTIAHMDDGRIQNVDFGASRPGPSGVPEARWYAGSPMSPLNVTGVPGLGR